MIITSNHGNEKKLQLIYQRIIDFFNDLKFIAPQLTLYQCWCRILKKSMEFFDVLVNMNKKNQLNTS